MSKAIMVRKSLFLLPVSAIVLSSCIEELTVPECTPVQFSHASTSGDTIITTTGLRYIDGAEGRGITADWCRTVAVQYQAQLLDGTIFDSTDTEAPLVFAPGFGDLIDGFEQGLIGMRPEGTRRLIIPAALGFGSEPRRDETGKVIVPGNSTVIYDIQVVQVAQ